VTATLAPARTSRANLAGATTAAGALAAAGNAALHLYLTPEHTNAEHVAMGHAYVGVLFAVTGVLLAAVAAALALRPFRRVRAEAWWTGAILNLAMAATLIISRLTTWMPAGYQEGWEPLAVACVALEVVFLAAFLTWTGQQQQEVHIP